MAANLSSSRKIATLGKRFFITQISSSPPAPSALLSRRSVHASVYDKNVDDHVRPVVVPDDFLQPQSEKYWSPNPHTGVFGPASEHLPGVSGERGFHTSAGNGGSESVLEQQTFFRPQEDLDKPEHV